jgi:hypothetical protein
VEEKSGGWTRLQRGLDVMTMTTAMNGDHDGDGDEEDTRRW